MKSTKQIISTPEGIKQRYAAISVLWQIKFEQKQEAVVGYYHETTSHNSKKTGKEFVLFRSSYLNDKNGSDLVKECPCCKLALFTFREADVVDAIEVDDWIKKAKKITLKHKNNDYEYECYLRFDIE